jgi:hypothetical protein
VTIEWGDGSSTAFELAQDDRSFAVDHQYLDNPPGGIAGFTTRVTIIAAEQMDIRSVPVQVSNVPPTIESANVNMRRITANGLLWSTGTIRRWRRQAGRIRLSKVRP